MTCYFTRVLLKCRLEQIETAEIVLPFLTASRILRVDSNRRESSAIPNIVLPHAARYRRKPFKIVSGLNLKSSRKHDVIAVCIFISHDLLSKRAGDRFQYLCGRKTSNFLTVRLGPAVVSRDCVVRVVTRRCSKPSGVGHHVVDSCRRFIIPRQHVTTFRMRLMSTQNKKIQQSRYTFVQ